MKTIKLEDGKEVKISEESYKALRESIVEGYKIDDDVSLVKTYRYLCDLPKDQPKIKTTKKKNKQVYVNQVFADNSLFGGECVFIKCKFGSSCEFGSYCKFDSSCEFNSGCKFGSGCKKLFPYWDETGKHEERE